MKALLIAIVDDNDSFRGAATSFVQSLGYTVAAFSSAEEFLQSGRIDDTACLISDVQMPGINGLELRDRLRTQGHRLPIIFVSAHPASELPECAMKAGAQRFLNKPFCEHEMISCLDQALANQKV